MGLRSTLLIAGGLWAATKLFSSFFDDDDEQGFSGPPQSLRSNSHPSSSSTQRGTEPPYCPPYTYPTSSDRRPSHNASWHHENTQTPEEHRARRSLGSGHATPASAQPAHSQPLSYQHHSTYNGVRETNVTHQAAASHGSVCNYPSTSRSAYREYGANEQITKREIVPAAEYEHARCNHFDSTQTVEPARKVQADSAAQDTSQKAHKVRRIRTKQTTQRHSAAPKGSRRRTPVDKTRLAVPSTVQPLSNFLPIEDRAGFERARQEARRLRNLKEKYAAKKCKAENSGHPDHYLVDRYETAINTQREAMKALNDATSKWIFEDNNRYGKVKNGTIDLHKLRVSEAIEYAKKAVADAEIAGEKRVRLIVGQGKHSEGGVPVLKPSVAGALKAQGYNVEVDSQNAGALVVMLE